jgi:hypothetical protein
MGAAATPAAAAAAPLSTLRRAVVFLISDIREVSRVFDKIVNWGGDFDLPSEFFFKGFPLVILNMHITLSRWGRAAPILSFNFI